MDGWLVSAELHWHAQRGRVFAAGVRLIVLVVTGLFAWQSAPNSAHATAKTIGELVLAQTSPSQPSASGSQQRITNPPPGTGQASGPNNSAAPTDDGPKAYVTFKTPYEFFLCLITVALGIAALLLLAIMYGRRPPEEFARVFTVSLVIFAALFLIVAGYNEKQTAPVFGLLGTVLGYIFGKVASPPASATPQNQAPPTNPTASGGRPG
jgi:hypothetical protein